MIYSINGELVLKESNLAVIECSGVGYACRTTFITLSQLGSLGSKAKLFTYLYVREDNIELFGFSTLQELNCFKLLVSVSGVGPKAAIAILSDIPSENFALTVASGDSKAFTKIKGIGAKIAQRIVLELKDKIAKESISNGFEPVNFSSVSANSNTSEAVAALVVLGYSQTEVTPIIAGLGSNLPSSELIKQALKIIGSKKF